MYNLGGSTTIGHKMEDNFIYLYYLRPHISDELP